MTESKNTVTILAERKADALEAIEKLVRKGKRYNCDEITFSFGKVYDSEKSFTQKRVPDEKLKAQTGIIATKVIKVPVKMIDIEIDAPRVQVGEYTFVAKLSFEGESIIIDSAPDCEADHRFRTTTKTCEHCNTNRNRKDLFVVADADGVQKQVGKSCLHDHLGVDPADALNRFRFFKYIEGFSEEFNGFGGGGGLDFLICLEALTLSAALTRTEGFVARGSCDDNQTPTASTVSTVIWPYSADDWKTHKEVYALVTDADKAKAEAVQAWAQALPEGGNDYMHNMKTVLSDGIAKSKRLGLIVSAVSSYDRAMGIEVKRKEEAEAKADSKHIGTVGERTRGQEVAVEAVINMGAGYAWNSPDRVLLKMITPDGNALAWFTDAGKLSTGETAVIDYTVKDHKEYKGVKETLITRGKVHEVSA